MDALFCQSLPNAEPHLTGRNQESRTSHHQLTVNMVNQGGNDVLRFFKRVVLGVSDSIASSGIETCATGCLIAVNDRTLERELRRA